ncbi:MAG: hypothetical protein AAF223_04375 [Bacteroidota bacterium]
MISSQTLATAFSILLLIVLLWPIQENWRKKPKDNFPLSYYPMFSHKRNTTYSMPYLVGYDSLQNRYFIPYQYAGTGGFNQVRRQMRQMVREDRHDELIERVAQQLGKTQRSPFDQLKRVDLVRGKYHFEDYFLHNQKAPISEKLLSTRKITNP